MKDATDLDSLRAELLAQTLPIVAFEGWTRAAMREAGAAAGIDSATVARIFPRGPVELLAYYSADADRRMLAALDTHDLGAMRVRDRVALAVRIRIDQGAGGRDAIRRGLALLALPGNAALGTRLLYRTVDAIWYAAGDRATDHNFYTKRALLVGVYMATLLHWLDDGSDGFAATWDFLDRRIGDVLRIPALTAGAARIFARLPGGVLRGRNNRGDRRWRPGAQ